MTSPADLDVDARFLLANERTLLAWVRTSIAVAALGFVVARFGLVVRELGTAAPRQASPLLSTSLGVALVLCSAALVVLATLRYRSTARSIEDNIYQTPMGLMLLLAGGFVVVAVLLTVYLVITT